MNIPLPTKTLTEAEVPEQDPAYDYPFGLVQFSLYCPGLSDGPFPTTVEVTLTFDGATDLSGYMFRKYGPTPDNTASHWYDFSFDGETGIVGRSGNAITFRYVDGRRGDDAINVTDLYIFDQIGPTPPASVPTMSQWGMVLFLLFAGIGAAFTLRRKGKSA